MSFDIVLNAIVEFSKSQLFSDFSLFFIMLYASSPSFFFMPNELLTVPAYLLGVSVPLIIVAVGVGGFLGDSAMFFLSKHIHKKITGKKERKVNHWLYKYKHLVFVFSPSAFFGLGDAIIILAGIKHFHFRDIVLYLFLGNLARGLWGMLLVVYGISLFDWIF